MKLTGFLLLAACLNVSATGTGQTVTISMKKAPIQKVFREVIRQTGISFVYDESLFEGARPVTIDVKNAAVTDVIARCLKGSPFVYNLEGNMIVLHRKKEPGGPPSLVHDIPPPITVKGTIVNENGEPMEGVTINVRGGNAGTSTDAQGNFTITAESTDVLRVSFVGYATREIAINNQSTLRITLSKNDLKLDEVVIVGYGTQKKGDLTGAVGVASGEVLENNAVPSVGQALQGKIAGLQIRQTSGDPGANVEFRIRGMGSFGAQVDPLIVVDGIITTMGLNDIDPSNIEDISILKDASSAAIYGSRGANGVVLVTTKRGRSGKPVTDFQAYYSIDNVIRKIPTVNATTYANMVNEYYTNQGKPAPFDDPASFGEGTNWQDQIFRTGGKQNYSLSVSGGSEKSTFALTMSYYRGLGTVLNSKYNRGNFRINNDLKPFKNMKIGSSLGLSYGGSRSGNPQEAIDRSLIYAPTVKPYNEDGTYGIASRAGEPTTMVQPLVAAYERNNKENKLRALGNVYAEYILMKGLSFRTNLGVEYFNFDGHYFTPKYNFGLGNSNGTAFLDRNQNNTLNWMVDNILTYTNTFNGDHDLNVMAGYTFQKERFESFTGHTEGFSRNDENLQVPEAGTANDRIDGTRTEWAIQSYLGRINYSYKGKYLFTSNVRIDQSSRFKSNNRTGVFPSFSAGWVLSEEDFLSNSLGSISYLKLRGGFGILGNQNLGGALLDIYPYQSIINSNLYYSLGSNQDVWQGAAPTSLANEDIKWEKTRTVSAGVEVNFFNDRLHVVADYYDRFTSDILTRVPLPVLSGLSGVPFQNVASVKNTGVELTVDYRNSAFNKQLSYNIGVNVSFNKNRVTRLNKEAEIVYWDARIAQGRQILDFFGYVHDGIFQTAEEIAGAPSQPNAAPGDIKFKDINDDKVIDANDRTYIGSNLAKQSLGINGGLRYKNFDLSFSINGDFGRDRVIDAPGFAITRGAEQTNGMYNDRWTGPGTSNWVPRIVGGDPNGNSRFSTFWLRSQDYVRIQNVQLGYDFSKNVLKATGLRSLRVYAAAQNLATFTDYPGFDPEIWATDYPIPRSFFFGVNIGLN